MDHLTIKGHPRHDQPIDEEGKHRTPKSKGIQRPQQEEYGDDGGYREQEESLENVHVFAFAVLSYLTEGTRWGGPTFELRGALQRVRWSELSGEVPSRS